jgi:hypothetical protein
VFVVVLQLMRVYEVLKYYTPEESAYSFAQLK